MDPFDGNEVLTGLVFAALDHGRSALAALKGEPMAPFAMTTRAGGRDVVRFAGTDYDEDQAAALTFARAGGFAAWAVGWDGYLTIDGVRSEALFVRARHEVSDAEFLFAWPYDRDDALRVQWLGDPAYLGRAD